VIFLHSTFIIILVIAYIQIIYNYTPEKNVYVVYSVADVLYLEFVLLVTLFRP